MTEPRQTTPSDLPDEAVLLDVSGFFADIRALVLDALTAMTDAGEIDTVIVEIAATGSSGLCRV